MTPYNDLLTLLQSGLEVRGSSELHTNLQPIIGLSNFDAVFAAGNSISYGHQFVVDGSDGSRRSTETVCPVPPANVSTPSLKPTIRRSSHACYAPRWKRVLPIRVVSSPTM